MKRILPIVLILSLLLAALISCAPAEEPTTTAEATETAAPSTTTAAPSTTSKKLSMGIDEADEGWAFWTQY